MSNYSIGLSGLQVAQQALDTAGTNLANAGTDGYHRQEVVISPVELSSGDASTGGAVVSQIRRTGDPLVDNALLRQQPLSGQLDQELSVLQNVQDSLGTVDSSALGGALSGFFDSLDQLASQPTSEPYLQQTETSANTLAGAFQSLNGSLTDLSTNVRLQAQQQVSQVNQDASQVAQLNAQIEAIVTRGGNANLLIDQRAQAISDLSKLADVQVIQSPESANSLDVSAWGSGIVTDGESFDLATGMTPDGKLGVGLQGQDDYQAQGGAGSIGGLLGLANGTLKDIQGNVDTLAGQIIDQVNRAHVQGVGTGGSFTDLTGTALTDGPLSSADADITAGQFYVRITDTATGQVSRCAVTVDPSDTLADVAAQISNLQVGADHPLAASVAGSRLHIQSQGDYKFDFLTAPTPDPTSSTLTGTSQPTISGSYGGADNQTYTLTVVGGGQVGLTDGLQLAVTDGAGETVGTVNVGSGYAAGDEIQIDQGLQVALGSGTLNAGESFTVQALADSDPTGFLAAAGINTFFQGNSAGTIAVNPAIVADPTQIAASGTASLSDNAVVSKLASLRTAVLPSLDDTTATEYFDQLLTGVGQQVQSCQSQQTSVDTLIQQLQDQQSAASGVDMNQEAGDLMVYQRMFQSMAKYLSTVDQTQQYLSDMVQ